MTIPSLQNTPLGPGRVSVGLGSTPPGSEAPLDPRAVEDARREIQTLVREIAQLAKADIAPGEFYQQMLSRLVSALAAVGGAVWTVGAGNQLQLAYQINLQEARLDSDPQRAQQHAALVHQVFATAEGQLVPPHSGSENHAAANPTDFLLILGPMCNDEGVQGVVEIFQRPQPRSGPQRGYLRFVQQMCELAGDFLKTRRLRHFADKENLWEQLDRFTRSVHQSLDVSTAAYTIANEGRRLIGCDRVSVAISHGTSRCHVAAISGQDTFDARSSVVTRLARLASAVTATGEPMWYTGNTADLAPQVEKALQAYLDVAHSKTVAVLPLLRPLAELKEGEEQPRTARKKKPQVVGALVVEQIEDSRPTPGLPQRVDVVTGHSAAALANAIEHHSLFLLPLWRALGKMRWVMRARTLPKTLAVLLVIGGVIAALALIPARFELESKGVLQPAERRDVFAGIDGVVIEVPVRHGQMVAEQELLAVLRNTDLEVQITDLIGRREATSKQLQALQRAMLGESRLTVEEKNRLAGQALQLRKTFESLELQLDLYRGKQQQLKITSPLAGQVVTWQVEERLLRRPVRQGQVLMNVANPSGEWELELHVAEDRMGHVAQAAQASGEPLKVSYILATAPGETHEGRVQEIHAAAEVRGEEGNTVLVNVAIDKTKLKDLRPGATVTAKIDCGTRSLGYVWLHDLFAFVQRKVLFRL